MEWKVLFEKQIAGKRHVITLQEEIEHVLTTNSSRIKFHETHHGGCAVLFNKDTFYTDIEVKSNYLHDTRRELPDKVMEGDPEMGLARGAFTCFFSQTTPQGPENIHSSVPAN